MSAAQLSPTPTVLILDQDPENSLFLRQEFECRGFFVIEEEDPEMALSVLGSNKIHAVIVDLSLPRQQLANLIKECASATYGSPAIFLLASASTTSRQEAYKMGATATFSKPIDPDTLVARVRELMVPAEVRWAQSPQKRTRKQRLQVNLSSLKLGRGGFVVPLENNEYLCEGDAVEFDVHTNTTAPSSIRGIGVVRYIHWDRKSGRQTAWGVEIESLDKDSVSQVLNLNESLAPSHYIPGNLH